MANDFSSDSACVAWYRFESGSLITDSIGGNTLTDNNTVGENTSDFWEGTCSADFESANSEHLSITDSDLDTDFPFKYGGSENKITVFSRFKFESVFNDMAPVSKWNSSNARSFIPVRYYGGNFQSYIGYNNGSSSLKLYEGGSPVAGRWYSAAWTFDSTTNDWTLVIHDHTDTSKIVDASGTANQSISISSSEFIIGSGGNNNGTPFGLFDGLIDETVVFNDIKSSSLIDELINGTYGNSTVLPINLNGLGQSQSIDSVSLTQKNTLAMNDLTHGMSLGSATLSQAINLIIESLNQNHSIGDVTLSMAGVLQVADILQSHGVDSIDVSQAYNLAVENLSQTNNIGSVDLAMAIMLELSGLNHSHSIDPVSLAISEMLVVDNLGHSHSLGSMDLSQAIDLVVNDLRHSQNLRSVSFTSLTGKVTLTFDIKIPGVTFDAKVPGVVFDME